MQLADGQIAVRQGQHHSGPPHIHAVLLIAKGRLILVQWEGRKDLTDPLW